MRTCICGRQYEDDVHFCSCGEFIAWDAPPAEDNGASGANGAAATRVLPAVARETAGEHVTVELFHAGEPIEVGDVIVSVPAGGRVHLMARVRNESDVVASYELSVEGLPESWWTVEPPTSYLMSRDSIDGYEEDVVVAFHPPRSPQALAGPWRVAVVATSQPDPRYPRRRGFAQAVVNIEPFREMAVEPRPETVTGTRRARLRGVVENRGNSPLAVTLDLLDLEQRCRFDILDRRVELDPGERGAVEATVRPLRLHWIGRRIEHRLAVTADTADEEPLKRSAPAVFRQRPLIAWWVPLLLLLLALAAVILWLLWPDRTTVPEVRKSRSAFNAQKRLEKKGLKLDPNVKTVRARRGVKPGTVIDQAPKPGTEVDKGKAVGITVVAGRTKLKVPKVTGLKIAKAEERLQNNGFTLGAVTPKVEPTARIKSQVPIHNVLRRRGTPINVVLGPKPRKKETAMEPAAAGAKPVPEVAGASAAAAIAELKAAGLTPDVEMPIDPAKRGTVLSTVPAEGEPPPPDGVVKLIVSAGFPQLAFDTGEDALVVGGDDGRPVLGVAENAEVATDSAWAPNGTDVVYESKGEVLLKDPTSPERAQPVPMLPEREVTTPAFAESEPRTILSFVDPGSSSRGDRVCWMDLTKPRSKRAKLPSCRLLRRWRVNALAWSPTGTELLAAASRPDEFGMLRLTTKSAFSSDARQWKVATKLATPVKSGRGVLAAAFSPGGGQLAVITNLETGDYRVALVGADDLALKKAKFLPVPACDVTWRPDGKELALVQAGSRCVDRVGPIVRVRPADPRTIQTIVLRGQHPSWQPVDFTLGPGR